MAARRQKATTSSPLHTHPSPTSSSNATPPISITDNPTLSLLPNSSKISDLDPYFHSTDTIDTTSENHDNNSTKNNLSKASSVATSPAKPTAPECSDKDLPPPYHSMDAKEPLQKNSKWTKAEPVRDTWSKKIEFLLAVVGFAVDLGNVWRFPYICYKNGGGAFLIPYLIMLIFGGLPLFFMELALGQYHKNGCLTVWKRICPMMKGIGYAICIIDLYMAMYYNTILAWSLYYLISSFETELPWTSCDNEWNTENCTLTKAVGNMSVSDKSRAVSPAKEFFRNAVLEVNESKGLSDIGPIKPSLAVCLFVIFILVYFSLWKGVKSSGKAVWVTAIFPYIVLIILLVRGVTLEGAANGIWYYITPRFEMLHKPKVWVDAATQIFFSLGPGFGTLLALSSYNKFHNNCYRDALITSSINCLTSFLAGFVIFSVLGYMAHVQNKDISEVGVSGPGLVFTVYPEAIATMSGSIFWSVIFFLMLITLGLDSTFGGLEAMITGLCDEYPKLFGRHRELFVGGLLIFIYFCALPTTTYGGMYVVDLLNIFGTGNPILFIVFVEAAAVFWFYGAERFATDIQEMIGFKPGKFWIICWKYISPIFIFVLFVCSFIYSGEEEEGGDETPPPPSWAPSVGWTLTASSIVCIPSYMIYLFIRTPGTFIERLRKMIKSEEFADPETSSALGTRV